MKKTALLLGISLCSVASAADSVRPLAADRPDATESPQTVDKGHFQIETSLLSYAEDRAGGVKQASLSLFDTLIKYGVNDNVDLHFGFSPYQEETVTVSGDSQTDSSHSDFEIRSKINLWGNDSGSNAFALLPYLKVPSGDLGNDEYEGGLIATYAGKLAGRSYGAQLQVDRVYNDAEEKHDWAGSHTLVTGYDMTADVSGYVEYVGEYTVEEDYLPYMNLGWTWQNSQNSQWDLGSQVALSDKGEDWGLFAGLTQRF